MTDPTAPAHPDVNADGTLWTGAVADPALPPRVRTVATRLAGLGVLGQVRALEDSAATAAAAAAALGVEVAAICNSLVFDADGMPLLVLMSGAHRVDTVKLAGVADVARVRRPDADFVRRVTGQPIGGVSPVGHPEPLRTLVDVDLARLDVVWAAAGHPHYVFPTSYGELLRITAGEAAEVAEPPR